MADGLFSENTINITLSVFVSVFANEIVKCSSMVTDKIYLPSRMQMTVSTTGLSTTTI